MERNYVIVILCFLSFHAERISCRLTLQTVLLCVEYEVSNDYVDISGSRHATNSLRLIRSYCYRSPSIFAAAAAAAAAECRVYDVHK